MPTRYQNGAGGSHGFDKPDRTCLRDIRTRVQDLTGLEQHIQYAYAVLGRAARSHGFGTPESTCLERIRTGLQDLTGKEHQVVHAYEVSVWGCMIPRVRNNSSNMNTRYQDGAAGSHG